VLEIRRLQCEDKDGGLTKVSFLPLRTGDENTNKVPAKMRLRSLRMLRDGKLESLGTGPPSRTSTAEAAGATRRRAAERAAKNLKNSIFITAGAK
jgi:hypothetical protein